MFTHDGVDVAAIALGGTEVLAASLDGADVWTSGGSPPPDPDPSGERVPFDDTSVYNESLTERYGASVPIHTDSDLMVEAVRRTISSGAIGALRHFKWSMATDEFTFPVYIPTASTPLATVAYSGVLGESSDTDTIRSSGGGTVVNVPVDPTWVPSAPNYPLDGSSDAQLIIWDRDNVLGHADGPQFWDFWRCSQVDTGDPDVAGAWATNGSGHYQCVNMSHFVGEAASSGVPGSTSAPYVSRGAGVPYIAGLVRKWELDAAAAAEGSMGHALACAYSFPTGTFVSPATKSDGLGFGPGDVAAGWPYSTPEGAWLKLADSFDVTSLSSAYARAVARTLQTYGAAVIDNTGRPKLYAEAALTAAWGTWDEDLLGEIPLEAFVVVDWTGVGGGSEDWSAALTGGVGGTPAVLGTVAGSTAGSTFDVVSASHSPLAGELLLAVVAERGIESHYVSNVVGNGMTFGWDANQWRSYIKTGVYATGQRNQWGEVLAARAPASPSSGAVTVTTTQNISTASKALQVLRLTAGSLPVRVVRASVGLTDTAAPSVTMKAPASGNLLLGIVMHRLGTCNDDATGWTANVRNTDGGGAAHVSTFTRTATGADVTFAPTLSQGTEWVALIVEVT